MNGVILVDKPVDWTSNDVVCKLKGVLHTRKVGHSGTLDPMATGLLPVFVGRATKAVEFSENDVKHYIAGIRLGVTTDTLDITGNVLSVSAPATEAELKKALPDFTGELMQIPPMYSAIKIKGQKLYNIARSGVEIEREPRNITVYKLDLLNKEENGDYILDVICSKGTYIRSLCDDIGKVLGCGACMSSLRRIGCGRYDVFQSVELYKLIEMSIEEIENNLLIPVDTVFMAYPEVIISAGQEQKLRYGNPVSSALQDGLYRVYSESKEFLILGDVRNGIMKIKKNFII